MIKYKIDGYLLEIHKISKVISKGLNMYHIYLQYNGGYTQLDFITSLEDSTNLDRLFTKRQKEKLLKKLKTIK